MNDRHHHAIMMAIFLVGFTSTEDKTYKKRYIALMILFTLFDVIREVEGL